MADRSQKTHPALLLAGVFLIAANLRAPFTIVGSLLGPIRIDMGLSSAAAGLLVTLPLLGFATVSPFGVVFARVWGLERSLFGALIMVVIGILLRSAGASWALYLGTALIGMSIAVGNVLLPSLIKRDFPLKIPAITGAYAVMMGAMAAVASGVAVPLAQHWGWNRTLAACLVLPLAALVAWLPQLKTRTGPKDLSPARSRAGTVWRATLAWQVTLFLGFNATIYYVAVAWLPSILVDAGFSPVAAGSIQGVMQLASALPGFLLGPVVGRLRDQRLAAVMIAGCSVVAYVGLLVAPRYSAAWAALFGFGSGAAIMLGLAFTGLRARNAQQAATLSGMAQGVGYLLASAGPTAMAALHDAGDGWRLPLTACIGLGILTAIMGWFAGRDLQLEG